MAVKAAKKTQTPKKAQPAKKTPTKATKKAENTPSDVKDVVPAETSKTTETSETPLDSVTHAKAENEGTTQVAPKRTKPLVQDLVGLENITTKCELAEEQIGKAISAAFKAYQVTKEKEETEKLFDDEPEAVNLLVSAIKIPEGEPVFFQTTLPNTCLKRDNDICLIVKDLEKGWKKDHEPSMHHYKELLAKKGIDFVDEILPLRQLRVEYKPFEARAKLSKVYDVVLVDKRVLKYVPRYLGKSFYQSGKFPISLNLEVSDLASEFDRALSTSLMSMSNKGSSCQIQVGYSNQTEKEIEENIKAVYSSLLKNFPGTFANVRSLALRFGTHDWTVPIYISCANQDTVTMPPPRKTSEPLVDDLTTLQPGFKVAVYPSGEVNVVKDENFKPGPLDRKEQKKPKKKTKKNKKKKKGAAEKSIEELAVADDSDEAETDGDEEVAAISDDDDDTEVKKAPKTKKKKGKDADSSEDEGDALEDEYMKELEMMEGEVEPAKAEGEAEAEPEVDENEDEEEKEEEEEAPPAKRSKVQKVNKKPAGKKSKKAVKSNP